MPALPPEMLFLGSNSLQPGRSFARGGDTASFPSPRDGAGLCPRATPDPEITNWHSTACVCLQRMLPAVPYSTEMQRFPLIKLIFHTLLLHGPRNIRFIPLNAIKPTGSQSHPLDGPDLPAPYFGGAPHHPPHSPISQASYEVEMLIQSQQPEELSQVNK